MSAFNCVRYASFTTLIHTICASVVHYCTCTAFVYTELSIRTCSFAKPRMSAYIIVSIIIIIVIIGDYRIETCLGIIEHITFTVIVCRVIVDYKQEVISIIREWFIEEIRIPSLRAVECTRIYEIIFCYTENPVICTRKLFLICFLQVHLYRVLCCHRPIVCILEAD